MELQDFPTASQSVSDKEINKETDLPEAQVSHNNVHVLTALFEAHY